MKNSIRVAICVMLVVAVLAMSLSVFADEGDRIVANEYLWAYYIYEFLHSIGIDVTYQGVIGYVDEVQDTIIDWVMNYIADEIEAEIQPSNYTIAKWIAPWQAGYDYWGNLQYNSTMLEDMQDFAEWLKAKLSLIDDNSIVYNPTFTLSGYNVYNFNTYYQAEPVNGGSEQIVYIECTHTGNAKYFVAKIGSTWYIIYVDPNGSTAHTSMGVNGYDSNFELISGRGIGFNPYGPYSNGMSCSDVATFCIPSDGSYLEVANYTEFFTWFDNAQLTASGDVEIITGAIVMPSDNPSYTNGDGVVIIDGEPSYQQVTFSGEITNLPAVISQGTVSDPHLDTFWGFIPVLADQTKEAIVLTRGLIYELPEELVVAFYAVMGGLILFGIIKLMREH